MNVLLCSRSETVRGKWVKALGHTGRVYHAASYDELQSLQSHFSVDLVLLHRSMVDARQLKKICREKGDSRIFVFSDRPDDVEGVMCLQLGCVGYANTYIAPGRLNAAVDAVSSGLVWAGSSLIQHLIKGLGVDRIGAEADEGEEGEADDKSLSKTLSRREYQIAGLVAEGFANIEIADQLEITERTVKAHLSSIYAKTHTKGRLSLALRMKKQ